MGEAEWVINTQDGAKIYGVTSRARNNPFGKAILIANGLGCAYFYHPYSAATLFFMDNGYDVIRFNFCDAQEKARNILDCNLETFVSDFLHVLKEHQKTYRSLYLVGHSYGGLIIANTNPEGIAAASLWDPSYNMADHSWAQGLTEDLPRNRVLLRWGGAYVISKRMWEDEAAVDKPYCRALSGSLKFPTQVIHAGRGLLHKYGESWHTHCPHATDYHLIENAGHSFEQLDSVPILLDKCSAWFGRF